MKKLLKTLLGLGFFTVFFLLPSDVFADLSIANQDVYFSNTDLTVGSNSRIFVNVHNSSDTYDLRGVVKIFDETEGIFFGGDQPISVLRNADDAIFTDFSFNKAGEHKIAIRVIPWDEEIDDPNNNKVYVTFYVDVDTDGDGIGNKNDPDDDNDGVIDGQDDFPLNASESRDVDNDGTGDNADDDDDNDGVNDIADAFPIDVNETIDTDNDGTGDNADIDDDNDKLNDMDEITVGTNSTNPDTDEDEIIDGEDDFPLDASKGFDTDHDGIDNEDDSDDDGDDVIDRKDAFPLDATEQYDSDEDGIGDNADPDDDNDKLNDVDEVSIGTDQTNPDSDDDGIIDGDDDFPLNASEQKDADSDGLGDNDDPDDSNKGPVVIATASKKSIKRGETITFDATSSYDPDGIKVDILWTFADDEEGLSDPKIDKTFDSIGSQEVTLKITDEKGEQRKKIFKIAVYPTYVEIVFGFLLIILLVAIIYYYTHKSTFKVKKRGGK